MQLNGDVLAAYLSTHGGVEEYKLITSAHGTALGDYVFTMILDRRGFHSIPHTITYRDTTMMVVVEGRKPLCWNCKKLGHSSRSCPQKTTITGPKITSTTADTINATTTTTTKTTTTATASTNSNAETGVQPEKEEGWILVKGNKKKSPQKTTTITTTIIAATPATKQTPNKKKSQNHQQEEMETTCNLKRRKDRGTRRRKGRKNNRKKNSPKPEKEKPQPLQPYNKQKILLKTLQTPTIPNTTYIITHFNPQNTIPVPFGNERPATVAINIWHCATIQVGLQRGPAIDLKKVDQKDITNPYLFEGAAMVTTFVRSAGNRTKELWQFIEEASRADMRLAEMGHDSLNEISAKCTGRVPIYVHPTYYRSLRLRFPYDVGVISRSSRVTPELCTGSLRQAVGILTPKDFRPLVDTD